MTQLILKVKQSEELSIPFTIKTDGTPLDLTGGSITVEVKPAPYATTTPMFSKTITETSDIESVGQITSPLSGVFEIRLLEADTSYQPSDYYLVIKLDLNNSIDIISSDGCSNAIYRICTQ